MKRSRHSICELRQIPVILTGTNNQSTVKQKSLAVALACLTVYATVFYGLFHSISNITALYNDLWIVCLQLLTRPLLVWRNEVFRYHFLLSLPPTEFAAHFRSCNILRLQLDHYLFETATKVSAETQNNVTTLSKSMLFLFILSTMYEILQCLNSHCNCESAFWIPRLLRIAVTALGTRITVSFYCSSVKQPLQKVIVAIT